MANPEMWKEFVEQPSKRDRKAEAQTRKRNLGRKPLAPVSEDQAKLKKRWALIKAAMTIAQIRTNGWTSCMACGSMNPKPLDLDHIWPAGKGGPWTPDNAELLCRRCHDEKHGNQPQFSGSDPRD